MDRITKRKVKSDVEWTVPVGGAGIALIFDQQWVSNVEAVLVRADTISRSHLHDDDDADDHTDPALSTP